MGRLPPRGLARTTCGFSRGRHPASADVGGLGAGPVNKGLSERHSTAPLRGKVPIGVFDSGSGHYGPWELKRALPTESFIYLGDTARLPYGPKPTDMVRGFADEIAHTLLQREVKAVVVACNTASAAALPDLAERLPVPTWGVVEPGVAAALAVAPRARIGVLGPVGTVRSRVYQDRLERAGATTWAQACPLFVPIVEEGVSDTEIARLVAAYYLDGRPPLDAVILGCTHYPALKGVLAQILGPGVALVDLPSRWPPWSRASWRACSCWCSPAALLRCITSSLATSLRSCTPPRCWAGPWALSST